LGGKSVKIAGLKAIARTFNYGVLLQPDAATSMTPRLGEHIHNGITQKISAVGSINILKWGCQEIG